MSQQQVLGYIILNKYDDIMNKLKNRLYESYEFHSPPYLRLDNSGNIVLYIAEKNSWVRVHEWGLSSYLGLLNMGCSTNFIANSLNVHKRTAEEITNDLFSVYWSERYTKKAKRILGHYVEDEFTKPQYRQPTIINPSQPTILSSDELELIEPDYLPRAHEIKVEGEIRYISTTLFKPFPDHQMGTFIQEHLGNDYNFFEGMMKPLMSSFRYISDNQVELDGRTTKLGLAFANSEFGAKRLDIGIYTMAVECSNQFISRNNKFRETIVHRRKSSDEFKVHVAKAVKNLGEKLENYGKAIVKAKDSILPIGDISEIIEHPPNRRFAQLPEVHIDGIIEAFKDDPIYNKNGKITKWSLFNACTRYIRDNRDLEDNDSFMNATDSLI